MYKNLINKINDYSSIVIFRHTNPDFDALGSQIGLKLLLLENFKNKNVYVVGDINKFTILGAMDEINDEIIKNSLAIIVDVADGKLVSDERYTIAKERIVIDHHKNDCNIDIFDKIIDTNAAATCQIIVKIAMINNWVVSKEAATALYSGIITDSGRFTYSLTEDLFIRSGYLIKCGADAKKIYDFLYTEHIKDRKVKAEFTTKFKYTPDGVGYMFNTKEDVKNSGIDFFGVSRGMVSVMANLEEIQIWTNFTYDETTNKIVCEFRSKKIPIVDIAKKYGGGGHTLACGCSINSFDEAYEIIEEFNKLLRKE